LSLEKDTFFLLLLGAYVVELHETLSVIVSKADRNRGMNSQIEKVIRIRSEIIQRVKKDLIQRLSLPFEADDLHEDISLIGSGLGLDSLDALEVILGIEQEFNVKVEEGNIAILRSINTIVDYILAKSTPLPA